MVIELEDSHPVVYRPLSVVEKTLVRTMVQEMLYRSITTYPLDCTMLLSSRGQLLKYYQDFSAVLSKVTPYWHPLLPIF